MVPSRVVSIALFALLQENISLFSMEVFSVLVCFLLMLHIHSSGKRNATVFAAACVTILAMEYLFFSTKRWHAQALIMLVPEHLPAFTVLIQAQFYYMAFVATSRQRIDNFVQPFAMACLVLLLMLPFEMLGVRFLWWTWHDTDPLLQDRILGVPVHLLMSHFFVAFCFQISHHLFRWTVLDGDYYEDEHWKREWTFAIFVPMITIGLTCATEILFYHLPVDMVEVDRTTWLFLLIVLSLTLFWMADREKNHTYIQRDLTPVDAYDSDWLYAWNDHAVNQMVVIHALLNVVLISLIDPTAIVSLGHHQPLGNCEEEESFRSVVGLQHWRRRFLCVDEFDEDFNLCNYPKAELQYEESWYMICGNGYSAYPSYVAVIAATSFFSILLFYQTLKRPQDVRRVFFSHKAMN